MTSRTRLVRKEVDDVLGGDEMWKHADSTMGGFVYPSNASLQGHQAPYAPYSIMRQV